MNQAEELGRQEDARLALAGVRGERLGLQGIRPRNPSLLELQRCGHKQLGWGTRGPLAVAALEASFHECLRGP